MEAFSHEDNKTSHIAQLISPMVCNSLYAADAKPYLNAVPPRIADVDATFHHTKRTTEELYACEVDLSMFSSIQCTCWVFYSQEGTAETRTSSSLCYISYGPWTIQKFQGWFIGGRKSSKGNP